MRLFEAVIFHGMQQGAVAQHGDVKSFPVVRGKHFKGQQKGLNGVDKRLFFGGVRHEELVNTYPAGFVEIAKTAQERESAAAQVQAAGFGVEKADSALVEALFLLW